MVALALTLPLLVFLLLTFLVPIGALLVRAVENPEVVTALPRASALLSQWDRKSEPPPAAFAAIAKDLSHLERGADAGALARRLNAEQPGSRSLVMDTYRATKDELRADEMDAAQVREKMLELDPRWAELPYWQAIAKNSSRWTPDYLLTSVDLRRDSLGARAWVLVSGARRQLRRVRSNGVPTWVAARSSSCRMVPGAGRATQRRW